MSNIIFNKKCDSYEITIKFLYQGYIKICPLTLQKVA